MSQTLPPIAAVTPKEGANAARRGVAVAALFSPRVTAIVGALLWTMLLGGSLYFNIERDRSRMVQDIKDDANTNLNKDLTFRKWATRHGGVYVPITDEQQPVPWLANLPGRDVTTTDGLELTLLNPASIIRQVMDSYSEEYGIRGRITGLKQLNPANAPDAWEKAQLESFARGERKEAMALSEIDGVPYMRHLRALYMSPGCEKCHAILGFKEGDLRGAIGVNIPLPPYQARLDQSMRQLSWTHGAIWLIGLLGIGWSGLNRERREKDLLRSEQRIREMSDAAGAYLWEMDTDMVYTYVSGQSAQVKGYAPEALLGHAPVEFMPEADVAQVGTIIGRAIADKSGFRLQHRDITPLGEVWWEEVHGSVYCGSDGKVIGLRGTGMSINARKVLEQERELYHKFFDASSDMMGIADPNGAFKKINRAFLEKLGYSEQEILSRPFIEFVHPEDRQATLDEMERQLRIGHSTDFRNRYRHRDGSYRWLSWRASHDPDEGVTYAVATDITERRLAQERLRESEEKFRHLFENMTAGFALHEMIYDEAGNPLDYRFMEINPAFERLTGVHAQDLLGHTVKEVLPGTEQYWIDTYGKVAKTGVPASFQNYSKEIGKYFEAFAFSTRKDQFAVVFVDITERKRQEDLVAARLRLTRFAEGHTLDELLVAVIDEAEVLTDSRIGFYHFVEADQENLTLQAWSTATTRDFCKAEGRMLHYAIAEAGVWVDCVRERKAVIHNDYASLPHRRGMPEGHAELRREVVVPTFRNDAIVAIMGVGNKEREYDQADVDLLQTLADWAWEIVQRKRAGDALRLGEQRIREMSDAAGAYLWELDADLVYTFVSGQSAQVKGYPPEALLGHSPVEFMPDEDVARVGAVFGRAIADKTGFHLQHRDITPSGEVWWEEVHGSVYCDADGRVIGLRGTGMGINARKAAEHRIQRLTNLYAALSECNQAIVRSNSSAELFPEICRDVVQYGGMKMAWIGLVDPAGGAVGPVASFGEGLDYLDGIRINTDPDDPHGQGPTGIAIREGRPVWNQDFLDNPLSAPWREKAARCGFRSSASLPIRRKGAVVGAFTLYAGEVNAFDEEARKLLEEMAADISYALDGYDRDASLRLAAEVFEQGKEGIMIADTGGYIVSVNRAFSEISGYSEAEALGQKTRLLSSGRQGKEFYREMWEAINTTGHWQGELWNRHKDGHIFPEWLAISRVLGADGKPSHYVGIFSDISQHKQAEERIQRLAHFDPLTGLPNRALLNDRARHAISMAQRGHETLAVLFLDLDHFKNINDTLGHRIGDELLIEIGNRMKAVIRDEDTISRQGGDEFILLLPDADADGAARVARKLIESVSVVYRVEQYELVVTPSIGIAMFPSDGEDFETLSKCADTAMYRAKREGRNAFRFFTPEMQQHSARKLRLEGALRHALEQDEFQLHYQPQVSLTDGRIVGVEALLRWRHPELGAVSPAEFIPVAEDSGLILPIGEWVLRTAARQMKAWLDAGMEFMVMAVNLSAVQFRHAQLPERVERILAEEGLPPDHLELELTEGVAMDDPLAAIAVMDDLNARGIRMSIDDFGTGYSSLSYLKRFQVYKLKIDQSFVRDLITDPEDKAIVDAVIRLAESLGLRTIAEGVENEEQLAFLRQQGCHEVQGYYFSRPLPAEEFAAFVRGWNPSL